MKNVMFLLGHFGIGGVERVTIVLATELVRRGHGVTICAFEIDDGTLLDGLDARIVVRELCEGWMKAANRKKFREIVGACAVVTKDVEPWTVVGGNPAKVIRDRHIAD